MKKLDMLKGGIGLVASIGAGTIAGNIAKSYSSTSGTLIKMCCVVGAFVISSMAGETASDYVEVKVDNTVDVITALVSETETEE